MNWHLEFTFGGADCMFTYLFVRLFGLDIQVEDAR
jgi:hypothetical protein